MAWAIRSEGKQRSGVRRSGAALRIAARSLSVVVISICVLALRPEVGSALSPEPDGAESETERAESAPHGKQIVGWVEKIAVGPDGHLVYAKLDTGAKTSSIHAESIERFKRKGEKWVRFTLVLESPDDEIVRVPTEAPLERRVRIKDHDDSGDSRLVVDLTFCMAGKTHEAQFSLADRSRFIYPVLLGRRFLAGEFVVDPEETFESAPECKSEKPSATPAEGAAASGNGSEG